MVCIVQLTLAFFNFVFFVHDNPGCAFIGFFDHEVYFCVLFFRSFKALRSPIVRLSSGFVDVASDRSSLSLSK